MLVPKLITKMQKYMRAIKKIQFPDIEEINKMSAIDVYNKYHDSSSKTSIYRNIANIVDIIKGNNKFEYVKNLGDEILTLLGRNFGLSPTTYDGAKDIVLRYIKCQDRLIEIDNNITQFLQNFAKFDVYLKKDYTTKVFAEYGIYIDRAKSLLFPKDISHEIEQFNNVFTDYYTTIESLKSLMKNQNNDLIVKNLDKIDRKLQLYKLKLDKFKKIFTKIYDEDIEQFSNEKEAVVKLLKALIHNAKKEDKEVINQILLYQEDQDYIRKAYIETKKILKKYNKTIQPCQILEEK
jgi:hypothetical protein